MLHLVLKILIRIELQEIIKPLLVIPVAALHFPIAPGRLRTDCLVYNVKPTAKNIQRMYAFCLLGVGKFSSVVRLNHAWCIAKVDNRTLHKVYRAVTAVFSVCV